MAHSGINVLFQGMNIERLIGGMWIGIKISIISILIGGFLGIFLGIIRIKPNKFLKFILRIYLELFRIIPILVWLYILYFILPTNFNIHLSSESVAMIVFSLWIAAEMSDIVRSSIISLPQHQKESGKALGLNTIQLYRYVLVPQAIKQMIPSFINLITRVIKTTSILVMIGVTDVIKVGQQIVEISNTKNPTASLWVYGFIFILFFIVCYPLSKISQILERKWSV